MRTSAYVFVFLKFREWDHRRHKQRRKHTQSSILLTRFNFNLNF